MTESNHSSDKSSLADESPFVRLLSTPGRVSILDVMLRQYDSKMDASEIADAAGIDEGTFSRNKGVLEDLNLLLSTNKGNKRVYQINKESEVVKILARAHLELLKHGPEVIEKTEISEEEYIGRIKSVGRTAPETKSSSGQNVRKDNILNEVVRKRRRVEQ